MLEATIGRYDRPLQAQADAFACCGADHGTMNKTTPVALCETGTIRTTGTTTTTGVGWFPTFFSPAGNITGLRVTE